MTVLGIYSILRGRLDEAFSEIRAIMQDLNSVLAHSWPVEVGASSRDEVLAYCRALEIKLPRGADSLERSEREGMDVVTTPWDASTSRNLLDTLPKIGGSAVFVRAEARFDRTGELKGGRGCNGALVLEYANLSGERAVSLLLEVSSKREPEDVEAVVAWLSSVAKREVVFKGSG